MHLITVTSSTQPARIHEERIARCVDSLPDSVHHDSEASLLSPSRATSKLKQTGPGVGTLPGFLPRSALRFRKSLHTFLAGARIQVSSMTTTLRVIKYATVCNDVDLYQWGIT